MGVFDIMGGIGAGISGITSIANLALGLENLDYQKHLQRDIFRREDTSVQRRVKDLKAAGLSPVLAAGQGAGTGGIVSTKPPEVNFDNTTALVMQMLQMEKDFAVKDQQLQNMQSQKALTDIQTTIKQWDLSKYVEAGTASNSSGIAKSLRDLYGLLKSPIAEQVKEEVKRRILKPDKVTVPGAGGYDYKLTPEDRQRAQDEIDRLKTKLKLK